MVRSSAWPWIWCQTVRDGDVDDAIDDFVEHCCLGKEPVVFKCVLIQSLKHSSHARCSLIVS